MNGKASMSAFAPLPFACAEGVSGKYLYLTGGYHSEDSGCPPWGTSDPYATRWIGDSLGRIVITYADGTEGTVPVILGHTLWLHSVWMESPAPFFGEGKDEGLTEGLRASLCVLGAFDKAPLGLLRVALPEGKDVVSVRIEGTERKKGRPVFLSCAVTDGEIPAPAAGETLPDLTDAEAFFASHTVSADGMWPASAAVALADVNRALNTYESDFDEAPDAFAPPEGESGPAFSVTFTGNKLAAVATGNVWHNMKNLDERTDADGFIHTSYRDAPSWRYDGFGPYVLRANSYTSLFYSRDAGRAIMTLNAYGYRDKAAAACAFGNGWMMAYPRDGVTLGGIPIPGHFSVMPNDPYVYSKVLSKIGRPALCDDEEGSTAAAWPTRYTRKRFGDEYENLGNQETDGHGLMMMGNYLTWRARGRRREDVLENWTYINEAAKWILWCYDHPELSFVENDLLYGETEAAMNTYTLYANVPCQLGLCGYAEMAEAAGKTAEAETWRAYAARLRGGIDRGLTEGDGWRHDRHGFFHDPVLTMMSDVYGFDRDDMPADWVARSAASYPADRDKTVAHGWYGAAGIGYDHAMITQNALLLDMTEDANRFTDSLCKLSYAPRLPNPYIVPEGLCVDVERGVLRRQGDLGNLVQLAEAMKCWLIVTGIGQVRDGVLKLMPRLPAGWSEDVKDFPIGGADARLTMTAAYPARGAQTVTVSVDGALGDTRVRFRAGPFADDCTEAVVTINGRTQTLPTFASGDRRWAWADVTL